MAIRCPCTNILVPRGNARKVTARDSLSCRSQMSIKASLASSKPCTSKVFEDKVTGIICYTDEKGQIVCEGYDEGPRFDLQDSAAEETPNRRNQMSTKESLTSRISCTSKVPEDKETGIICYTDKKGEIICEGYDEGPRFDLQDSEAEETRNRRQKEIEIRASLLQLMKLQVVEDTHQYLLIQDHS